MPIYQLLIFFLQNISIKSIKYEISEYALSLPIEEKAVSFAEYLSDILAFTDSLFFYLI